MGREIQESVAINKKTRKVGKGVSQENNCVI